MKHGLWINCILLTMGLGNSFAQSNTTSLTANTPQKTQSQTQKKSSVKSTVKKSPVVPNKKVASTTSKTNKIVVTKSKAPTKKVMASSTKSRTTVHAQKATGSYTKQTSVSLSKVSVTPKKITVTSNKSLRVSPVHKLPVVSRKTQLLPIETPAVSSPIERDSIHPKLTVQINGRGRVVSLPAGLDCGDGHEDCVITRTDQLPITLTATPDAHQKFKGWHVAGSPDACQDHPIRNNQSTCAVRMDMTDLEVQVDFSDNKVLTVQSDQQSTGEGAVTERSLHWHCNLPGPCYLVVPEHRDVHLRVTPYGHSVVAGWSVLDGSRSENHEGQHEELDIAIDHDKTVNVVLQGDELVTDDFLTTNGCELNSGSSREYTCHTMSSYMMCQQAFQNDTVHDCHVGNFTSMAFEELRTMSPPTVSFLGAEASITVHKSQRGSKDALRSATYKLLLQTPPPLDPDNVMCHSNTRLGSAICERACSHQAVLRADAKTGATISLVKLADHCNVNINGSMTPSYYDALKAYDLCRSHSENHGIEQWNFTLRSHLSERVGAVYYFNNNRTQGDPEHASVEPGVISYQRTEVVEPPLQILCRE